MNFLYLFITKSLKDLNVRRLYPVNGRLRQGFLLNFKQLAAPLKLDEEIVKEERMLLHHEAVVRDFDDLRVTHEVGVLPRLLELVVVSFVVQPAGTVPRLVWLNVLLVILWLPLASPGDLVALRHLILLLLVGPV